MIANCCKILLFSIVFLFTGIFAAETKAAQYLFTPEMILSGEYSDNIFLSPAFEEDDYITSAGLNLTMQILSRTAGFELTLNPVYNAFANNSELDFWRYAGRVRLWDDFRRNNRIELFSDYLETENPRDLTEAITPDDPLAPPPIDADLNRRGRNRYRVSVSGGRYDLRFGARDRLSAAVEYRYQEDIDILPDTAVGDYSNWQPSLGLEYWFTQRWGFSVDGHYSARDYAERNDRQEYAGTMRLQNALSRNLAGFIAYQHLALDYDQEIDDDYQIYEPSIGFSYQFQERARITLGLGYYVQEFENQEENKNEDWVINSEVYKRWAFKSSYLDFTGISGKEIADRGSQDLGLNVYFRLRLELGHQFTSRFSGSLFGSYGQNEYINTDPSRTDKISNAGAELRYQALQWMYLRLTYNHNEVLSDDPTQEYRENSVVFMVTMRPTTPYRLN